MKQLLHRRGAWQQHQWKRSIRLPLSVLSHWAASPAFLQPIKLPWQQSEARGCGMAWGNAQWLCVRKLQKGSIQWPPPLWKKCQKMRPSSQASRATLKACLPRHSATTSKEYLDKTATLVPFFIHLTILQTQQCCHNHNFGPFSADFILLSLSFAWDCDALLYIKSCKACRDFCSSPNSLFYPGHLLFEKCDTFF